ncbi:MAG: DNA (cytosine-5-)-methyltransferase [Verrucomicrobiota bacterium]
MHEQPTLGSLFAGFGGFDLGFHRAGFRSVWQVELNPASRALLAARFGGRQHADVRYVGEAELERVDVITAGFPCQDASAMGSRKAGGRRGLSGERTGLFWEVLRIAAALRTKWLVLENVVGLLNVNDGKDFQTVLQALAAGGYHVAWRVLDSRYFGVAQARRRVFLLCRLGQPPPLEFLADAGAVEGLPITLGSLELARGPMAHAANTLTACNAACRVNLGSETLVAIEDGWSEMAERGRTSQAHGIPLGLDGPNFLAAYGAGNAVVPACAEWIAKKIAHEMRLNPQL